MEAGCSLGLDVTAARLYCGRDVCSCPSRASLRERWAGAGCTALLPAPADKPNCMTAAYDSSAGDKSAACVITSQMRSGRYVGQQLTVRWLGEHHELQVQQCARSLLPLHEQAMCLLFLAISKIMIQNLRLYACRCRVPWNKHFDLHL